MTDRYSITRGRRWAYLIGFGMTLFPINNLWLTDLVTNNADGKVEFFLPSFGAALWILGTLLLVTWNWEVFKARGLGDKCIWIPLLVIVAAIGLSGIGEDSIKHGVAPLFTGCTFFCLYLAGRVLGNNLFKPLAVGAVIAALGVIAYGIVHTGKITGGYVFDYNYDIVIGYMILGAVLMRGKWQWALVSIALVGVFMSGSPEGLFVVGVLGAFVLLRRDWSWRLVWALIPVILVAGLWFGLGYGQDLYQYAWDTAHGEKTVRRAAVTSVYNASGEKVEEIVTWEDDSAIGGRWDRITDAWDNLEPLGDGFELTQYDSATVHNVPLILPQQLGWPGILAALCWLWVSLWCLFVTKMKYAALALLALAFWDHFVWTQMGCIFWSVVGVSVACVDDDLIFRNRETTN